MRALAPIPPLALALSALAGCYTFKAYDGPPAKRDEVATITADPRFNAGLPVVVALRKVDDKVVGVAYDRLALEPGRHDILVDCNVQSSKSITRFPLTVEVEAGAHYQLVAELAPGNQECGTVRLERR
jgi:hypothetical protein